MGGQREHCADVGAAGGQCRRAVAALRNGDGGGLRQCTGRHDELRAARAIEGAAGGADAHRRTGGCRVVVGAAAGRHREDREGSEGRSCDTAQIDRVSHDRSTFG